MKPESQPKNSIGIEPLLVQTDFLQPQSKIIQEGLQFEAPNGGKPVAYIVDSIIAEDSIHPELGISILIDRSSEFTIEPVGLFLYHTSVQKAVDALLQGADDMIWTLDSLSGQLPLKNVGKYIRSYIMGDITVLSMEHLEGWLEDLIDDFIDNPSAIANRCQVCTILMPIAPSAHERLEALTQARTSWEQISAHIPENFGSFSEMLHISPPDFTTYPEAR
jgi:hypothetical protein